MATGIDLNDYTLIDQELNTGNNIKDYRLDLLFKKDNTIVNLEVNYEVIPFQEESNIIIYLD